MLRNLNYEDSLKVLKLKTLEERRVSEDLIHAYRIITGKDNRNCEQFLCSEKMHTLEKTV